MISCEEALEITRKFSADITNTLTGKIRAIFAIGSLGGDYYRPGQSDIDTVVITSVSRNEIQQITSIVETIADRYWREYQVPKGFGAIVFAEEQLHPPYIKSEELVQEIMRLKMQGKLIYGEYDINNIEFPDWQAIKNDILNFQEWSDEQPYFEHSAQSFVNSTLMGLKRYLLLKHHIVEFNKFKAIGLYLANNPPVINEEIFTFITNYISGKPYIWNDEIRSNYTNWHDHLFVVINNLVLYNE